MKLEPFNDNHVLDIRVYLDKIVISEEERDLLSICELWVSFFTFLNFFVNTDPVASLDSTGGFFRGDRGCWTNRGKRSNDINRI